MFDDQRRIERAASLATTAPQSIPRALGGGETLPRGLTEKGTALVTAKHALARASAVATLLACATACGNSGSGTANRSPGATGSASPAAGHLPVATPPACDLLSESTAQAILGLTIGLSPQDGTDSCKYLIPGTAYRDVDWTQLRTNYTSANDAVTAAQALYPSTAWTAAQSPAGLGPGAQVLSSRTDGHDSQGIAVRVDGYIIVWQSPGGTFQALLTSELTEDANSDRALTAAEGIRQAENGTPSATSDPGNSTAAVASTGSDGSDAGGSPWTLTGSCPNADTLSSALGISVQAVTAQDGVACQYHAVNQDIGLDLYTAESLHDERLSLDAAHGAISTLDSLGPGVEQAWGNGNFFNICSVSAPWGADGGGVVAEAKDASIKPLEGKDLCPAALALFTAGAHRAS